MKVLIDGSIYSRTSFGGVVRYVTSLVSGLLRRGLEVRLATDNPQRVRRHFPEVSPLLVDRGERVPHDVLHVPVGPLPIDTNSAFVATVHDLIDEMLPSSLLPGQGASGVPHDIGPTLARADHLIAVSETTRCALLERYCLAPDRVTTVRHGLDPEFRQAACMDGSEARALTARLGIGGPFLLHVGGREGYKNFLGLLRAYGATPLRERFRLVAVGSQTHFLPAEQAVVDAFGLVDRVSLTGRIEDYTLAALYRTAAVVVLPSLCEGFGLPLLEAMASGAFVAASTAPALRELGGDVPVYFEPTDPMDIADGIEKASGQGDASRRYAIERASRFRWEDAVRDTMRIYQRVSPSRT